MARRPLRTVLATVTAAVLAVPGCSGNDGDADDGADEAAPATITVPPSRLSPFCQAMIDLELELDADPPPDDPEAIIIETYLAIVDDVPEAIKPDFLVVLADLQGTELPPVETTDAETATGGTTSPDDEPAADDNTETTALEAFDAEGRLPAEESEQRVSGYVQFACRNAVNNPGPPATPPLDDLGFDESS